MRFLPFLAISLASAAVIDTSKATFSLHKRVALADAPLPATVPTSLWTDPVTRIELGDYAPPAKQKPPPPAAKKPPPPPPKKKCRRADPACNTGPTPPKAPEPPKHFKPHGPHHFLDIDAPSVGFLLANGKYELRFKGTETVRGQLTAQQNQFKKIGTDTLATCTAVFLVARGGTIGAHLPPDACELYLASSKKGLDKNRKKELKDQMGPDQYKKWKKAVDKISDKGTDFLKDNRVAMEGYRTYIVKGIWAPNDEWGNMMAADIFGQNHEYATKWSQTRKLFVRSSE